MRGDTRNDGQLLAFVSAVITELPRIGVDISEMDAQAFISDPDGRDRLNGLLWRALATRTTITVPCAPLSTKEIINAVPAVPLDPILPRDDFVKQFHIRPEAVLPGTKVTLELMRFNEYFLGTGRQIQIANHRDLDQPLYEDALFFAVHTSPVGLGLAETVVFPHEPAEIKGLNYWDLKVQRCIVLRPLVDHTYDHWQIKLRDIGGGWPKNTIFAFRHPDRPRE